MCLLQYSVFSITAGPITGGGPERPNKFQKFLAQISEFIVVPRFCATECWYKICTMFLVPHRVAGPGSRQEVKIHPMEAVAQGHADGLPTLASADDPLEFDPEITASIGMVRVVTHKINTGLQGARWQRLDLAAGCRVG